MKKDRGAELGDVDGPLGCSLALGVMAAEACSTCGGAPSHRSHPVDGAHSDGDVQRLRDEYYIKMQQLRNFQLGGPESLLEQTHSIP